MAHVVIDLFQYIFSALIIYRLEIMRNILFYIQFFFFLKKTFNLTAFAIIRMCHHFKIILLWLDFGLSTLYLFCYFHCNEYIYS